MMRTIAYNCRKRTDFQDGLLIFVLLAIFSPCAASQFNDFLRHMQRIEHEKELASQQESLQDALRQAAQRVTPELARKLNLDSERNLGYYNDDLYNGYGYQYYNDQYNQGYYYNDDGNNNDNYDQGIDLTEYALKYVGCQNIHTWSDDRVQAGLNPMKMDRFVVMRLCESESCSAYNKWGCNYNFGEYALPMEDYLAIMSSYHFDQYNRYCQVCKECMNFDYQAYVGTPAPTPQATSNNDDDAAYAANDDGNNNNNDDAWSGTGDDDWYWSHYYYGDEGGNRRDLQNYNNYNGYNNRNYNNYNGNNNNNQNRNYNNYYGSNYNDDNAGYNYNNYGYNKNGNYQQQKRLPWYLEQDGTCSFSTVCDGYQSACQNYHPNATYYRDYFMCTQYKVANGVQYVGPHCRSDGHTIGIAIYEDEYCNEFVQEMNNNHYDDNELSLFFDKSCVSCMASDGYSLIKDAYVAEHAETYPLCEVVYEFSAKCNRYMDAESELYIDDEDSQNSICPFIGSLIENTYNEFGEIVIQQDFDFSNWKSSKEYINLARKASAGQIFGLVLSMILTSLLLVYACYLQKKLFFRKPWRPPSKITSPSGSSVASGFARSEAGRISRNNSGIMAMRSLDNSERGSRAGGVTYGDMSYATHGDVSTLTGPSKGAFA